jgi:hypothetical protein
MFKSSQELDSGVGVDVGAVTAGDANESLMKPGHVDVLGLGVVEAPGYIRRIHDRNQFDNFFGTDQPCHGRKGLALIGDSSKLVLLLVIGHPEHPTLGEK